MNSNTIWLLLIIVAAIVVYSACARGKNTGTAKDKIKQGALILDVRTPQEFAGGAYPGAKNIPVQELQARLNEVGPTNHAIVVYCAAGIRAGKAKKILMDAGFKDVTNAGGLSDIQK
jgi:phage shock protein E